MNLYGRIREFLAEEVYWNEAILLEEESKKYLRLHEAEFENAGSYRMAEQLSQFVLSVRTLWDQFDEISMAFSHEDAPKSALPARECSGSSYYSFTVPVRRLREIGVDRRDPGALEVVAASILPRSDRVPRIRGILDPVDGLWASCFSRASLFQPYLLFETESGGLHSEHDIYEGSVSKDKTEGLARKFVEGRHKLTEPSFGYQFSWYGFVLSERAVQMQQAWLNRDEDQRELTEQRQQWPGTKLILANAFVHHMTKWNFHLRHLHLFEASRVQRASLVRERLASAREGLGKISGHLDTVVKSLPERPGEYRVSEGEELVAFLKPEERRDLLDERFGHSICKFPFVMPTDRDGLSRTAVDWATAVRRASVAGQVRSPSRFLEALGWQSYVRRSHQLSVEDRVAAERSFYASMKAVIWSKEHLVLDQVLLAIAFGGDLAGGCTALEVRLSTKGYKTPKALLDYLTWFSADPDELIYQDGAGEMRFVLGEDALTKSVRERGLVRHEDSCGGRVRPSIGRPAELAFGLFALVNALGESQGYGKPRLLEKVQVRFATDHRRPLPRDQFTLLLQLRKGAPDLRQLALRRTGRERQGNLQKALGGLLKLVVPPIRDETQGAARPDFSRVEPGNTYEIRI